MEKRGNVIKLSHTGKNGILLSGDFSEKDNYLLKASAHFQDTPILQTHRISYNHPITKAEILKIPD